MTELEKFPPAVILIVFDLMSLCNNSVCSLRLMDYFSLLISCEGERCLRVEENIHSFFTFAKSPVGFHYTPWR